MTGGEQELLEKYLTHLKFPGVDGSYPDLETWYKEVRCACAPALPGPWSKPRSCVQGHLEIWPETGVGRPAAIFGVNMRSGS